MSNLGIGITLKSLLKDKNMTAKELSEKTGISINTIYAILKRDNDSIKPDFLFKIAKTLNVSPESILEYAKKSYAYEAELNHRIFLMNEWLDKTNFKIIKEYDSAMYSLIDKKRKIGLYLNNDEINIIYDKMKTACENTANQIILEQLNKRSNYQIKQNQAD